MKAQSLPPMHFAFMIKHTIFTKMGKYTIISTIHTYGSLTQVVEENKVREECERLRKSLDRIDAPSYRRIEVVNNDTGEIREYWNNNKNEIMF